MSASDTKNEAWDSDDAWASARARTREEVRAAFAPRTHVCRNCGNEETSIASVCSRCGTPFVERLEPGMSRRAKRRLAIGAAVTVVVLGIAGALIVPAVQHSKSEANARDRAEARATFA